MAGARRRAFFTSTATLADPTSPLPRVMQCLYVFLGPDRLLFARDHPWVEPQLIRDAFTAVDMTTDDREKIASLNANKLLQP